MLIRIMITSLTRLDLGVDNDNDNLIDQGGPGCCVHNPQSVLTKI